MKKTSQAVIYKLKKENDIFKKIIRTYAVWLIILLIIIIMSFLFPVFFSFRNFITIFKNVSPLAVVAVGMTFVFLGGGFDLSQGAVLLLTSTIIVNLNPNNWYSFIWGILLCFLASLVVGSINGYFIGIQKMNPFITTLAVRYILGAIIYIITAGAVVSSTIRSKILETLGIGNIYKIPILSIVVAVILIICWFVIGFTVYSRKIKLIGSSLIVSRFTGLNFSQIQMSTYVVNAFLAGIAGILVGSQMSYVIPTLSWNYDFDAITACAVGGISLSGGSGSIINTLSGVLLIGFINNAMVILGLEQSMQLILKGLILLSAIIIDMQLKKSYE